MTHPRCRSAAPVRCGGKASLVEAFLTHLVALGGRRVSAGPPRVTFDVGPVRRHRRLHDDQHVPRRYRPGHGCAERIVMNADAQSVEAVDSLGVVAEAAARTDETLQLAARYLDPSLVDVLRILGFDEQYVSAAGSYLYDADGPRLPRLPYRRGVRQPRPQPPRRTRASCRPRSPPTSSTASRSTTRRWPGCWPRSSASGCRRPGRGVLRQHGRRGGRLGDEVRARGDRPAAADLLRQQLSRRHARAALDRRRRLLQGGLRAAAARAARGSRSATSTAWRPSCARRTSRPSSSSRSRGAMVTLPPAGYLEAAQELCRRYGTLFVLDEVQTGLGRTGSWFALEHWGLEPDFVLVGKALSGGYMPVAAMVTRREIFQRAVGTLERSLRAPVDLRAQPAVDGGRPGDAADHRARSAGRARAAHRRRAARRARRARASATR